jgi:hypothetical protein
MGMMSELGKDSAYARVLRLIDGRLSTYRQLSKRAPKKWAHVIKEFEQFRQIIEAAKGNID